MLQNQPPFFVGNRHPAKKSRPFLCLAISAGGLFVSLATFLHAQEGGENLIPYTSQGQPITGAQNGAGTAWKTSRENPVLLFKSARATASENAGDTKVSYLHITYLDRGYGRMSVSFKTPDGTWAKPDLLTAPVLLDTGKSLTSYERCPGLAADHPEIKIALDTPDAGTLSVSQVVLQAKPPADKHFQYLLDEAWKRPYDGPASGGIDNRTLKGKVMVGYQGWFHTPNDPYNAGWFHWGNMAKREFNTDMWPDTSEYPPDTLDKAADVKTLSGKSAYLFSSGWPEAVRLHFAWMRRHGIDGAFLQRFLAHPKTLYPLGGGAEWTLGNVRDAANREGRIWAVEYDVSSVPDDKLLEYIRKDWMWLVDGFGLRQDRSYAHEGGKPVVFVWGMSLPSRHISVATANAVVDFLKNDPGYGGNYVIGGISGNWHVLGAAWQEHLAHHDCVLSWHSKDYAGDEEAFRKMGIGYYPMVWPGFSWSNLKHLPTPSMEGAIPRAGGQFYEDLLSKAVKAGAQRLFVGMFDEYDEGTAIMPMSDDPPPTNHQPGTSVKFYVNEVFEGSPSNINVPRVDLALDGSAPEKGKPGTRFSLRYDGEILAPATGPYAFAVSGVPGDLVRLTVGEKKLDVPVLPTAISAKLMLGLTTGQQVVYKLEYRHGIEPGRLRLLWQKPGDASLEPVPDSAFLDNWGRFLTNEGQPPDHWLSLTGKWKRILAERMAQPAVLEDRKR